jgi:hypothetical protein
VPDARIRCVAVRVDASQALSGADDNWIAHSDRPYQLE